MITDITNLPSPRYGSVSPTNGSKSKSPKSTSTFEDLDVELRELHHYVSRRHKPEYAYMPLNSRVYHVYSDGSITTQPGSIQYMKKEEHLDKPKIVNSEKYSFHFPYYHEEKELFYAVVNDVEANIIRAKMKDIVLRYHL
jgi:hypothetical protein